MSCCHNCGGGLDRGSHSGSEVVRKVCILMKGCIFRVESTGFAEGLDQGVR